MFNYPVDTSAANISVVVSHVCTVHLNCYQLLLSYIHYYPTVLPYVLLSALSLKWQSTQKYISICTSECSTVG